MAAQWIPDHAEYNDPDFQLQFTQLPGVVFSEGSADDIVRRISLIPENQWIALAPPTQPHPRDVYHMVQTIAKGLFDNGDIDEGEDTKVRFPRPCDGRHLFTWAGTFPNAFPWPRGRVTYAFFNPSSARPAFVNLMIVRNVPSVGNVHMPLRERSRSRDRAAAN